MEIPHLSFLAVPVLNVTDRRVSTERDDDKARSNTTTVSESLSAIRSKPEGSGSEESLGNDSMMLTPSEASHAVSNQQEKKLKVFEDHLKAMEDIEMEERWRRDCHVAQNKIN
jgi:hypothetical protein